MNRVFKYLLSTILVLLLFVPFTVSAKESRLHDETGSLTSDEFNEVLAVLDNYSEKHKIDICVNIVNDTDGYSIDDYANKMFDYYGYGYDENYSCILLTIDMSSREYYHTTDLNGIGFNYISDYSIDNLGDCFVSNYQYGLKYALLSWADMVDDILTSAESGEIIDVELAPITFNFHVEDDKNLYACFDVYNFDGEYYGYFEYTGKPVTIKLPIGQGYQIVCYDISDEYQEPERLNVYVNNSYDIYLNLKPENYLGKTGISAGIGAVVAAIYSGILAGKNKSVSKKQTANTYLRSGSFKPGFNNHDNYLYTTTSRVAKAKNDDNHHSSSSHSSGGSSFSGSTGSHSGGRGGGHF